MSLKIGIVGLPNVGKSTLFNALMRRAAAEAANHPFTTIEPNVGIVDLPDERLKRLYDIVVNSKSEAPNHKQIPNSNDLNPNPSFAKAMEGGNLMNNIRNPEIIPATVTFVDIAGIIKGASQGEGLGNQFLSHIREADALAIVLRCFSDDNVIHVAGAVNPLADAQVVLLELILADLSTLQKKLDALEGEVRRSQEAAGRLTVYRLLATALENEQLASSVTLTVEQEPYRKELQLLTSKPILYVANVAEADSAKSSEEIIEEWQLSSLFTEGQASLVPISAKVEAELSELDSQEAKDYLKSLGLNEPGLNRLIRAGFNLLDLATYFTAGPKEVRAWTIQKGWKAPQAAGVIHGDFAKGFIRAEVIAYEDYLTYSGEQGAKLAGRLRSEGKEYVMADGDVVHFRFNV